MASIARRPDGTYRPRYRDENGKEHARHFKRKVDAQRWLNSVTAALETGNYVDPRAGRIKVGEWAEKWFEGQAQLKPTTRSRYRSVLDMHVLPHWSASQLVAVSHADVQAWVAQQHADGAAPATVRKHFRVLSLVLDLAVRDGRLPRNPCQKVNLPRVKSAGVVCDGYRVIFVSGQALSAGMVGWSVTSSVSLVSVTGRRRQRARTSRPR